MREKANSVKAQQRLILVLQLQQFFIKKLQAVAEELGKNAQFIPVEWLRDNGKHGGGVRFIAKEGDLFNRASINVSQIHFADQPEKSLLSATALSAIIHPLHPLTPSVHLHISWSELKNGTSYWRIMVDLNPAIANAYDKELFDNTLKAISGRYFALATKLGDDYFYIPALQRFRGVSHFYLERFNPESGGEMSSPPAFAESVISCYCAIVKQHLLSAKEPSEQQKLIQLNYHTLYFYQVVTLDRGTAAGLLAHSQNDIGTLGSLPSHINRVLLESWIKKTPAPQKKLIERLLNVLPEADICKICNEVKVEIAEQMRLHYLSPCPSGVSPES